MNLRLSLLLGTVSAINMLTGILFQWLLLTMLGPGRATDSLFAAMTVPQLFTTVVGAALTQVLVPLLAGETREHARGTAWSFIALCLPLFAVIAATLAITAACWVPLIVAGFEPAAKAQTVLLTKVMLLGMVFTGIIAVQQAAAFARARYVWPDVAQTIANLLALMLLYVLLPGYGVAGAAWITVGRLLLQSLLMVGELGRFTRPALRSPELREGWRRMRPIVLGSSYYKMDPLVDRFLLSSLAPGSLSLFYLAQQLYGAASQIVTKALATPAITRISIDAKSGDRSRLASDFMYSLGVTVLFCTFCVIGLGLIGKPVLTRLLAHGLVDARHIDQLWLILLLAGGMFVFGAAGSLLAGVFYAFGDTRTPTLLGSIAFTVSIAVKMVMFARFGVFGLAATVTFQYVLATTLMLVTLGRRGLVRQAVQG